LVEQYYKRERQSGTNYFILARDSSLEGYKRLSRNLLVFLWEEGTITASNENRLQGLL